MTEQEFLSFLDAFDKGNEMDKLVYCNDTLGESRLIIGDMVLHIDRTQVVYTLNSINDTNPEISMGSVRQLALLCAQPLRHHISDKRLNVKVIDALMVAKQVKNKRIKAVAKKGLEMMGIQ